jgi:VanZ family protein
MAERPWLAAVTVVDAPAHVRITRSRRPSAFWKRVLMIGPASLRPERLPQRLKLAAYGAAVAVLLYLTLAPGDTLPGPTIWDKAEHGLAWFVLTAVGLAFWPARSLWIASFAFLVGALVEMLQTGLPFGRNGELRDLLGDSVGIAAGLILWAMLRRLGHALDPSLRRVTG